MRGKTNLAGGGMALNANERDFTVGAGNVVAGDFVEYKYNDAVKTLFSAEATTLTYMYPVRDNVFMCIHNNVLKLFEVVDGELVLLDSYNDILPTAYVKVTDELFVMYHTGGTKIILFNISGNSINVISEYTSEYDRDVAVHSESKIIKYGYDRGGALCYEVINISDPAQPTRIKKDESYIKTLGVFRGSYNGVMFFTYVTYSGSSAYYKTREGRLTSDNIITNKEVSSIYLPSVNRIGTDYLEKSYRVAGCDERFVYWWYSYAYERTPDASEKPKTVLNVYDLQQGAQANSYDLDTFFAPYTKELVINTDRFSTAFHFNGDKLVISGKYPNEAGETKLIAREYKLVGGEIQASTELLTTDKDDASAACVFVGESEHVVIYPSSDSKTSYVTLTRIGDTLGIGKKEDTVKRYSGNYGNPLGVAKENGATGEVIKVYVPSV